ncbi:MAG: 4'-phosphopantetheinyl transferase superfamily protein [Candidatus Nanopelagicales bacterium]
MRWWAGDESGVPGGLDWLTDVEAGRAASMRFTKRRTEYLLRRWTGKCAVAAAIGLPSDVESLGRIGVHNRRTGAPFVQVDGRALELDISLTDRAGWAVCLVGPDLGAVGCDLEIVEPRSDGFVADFLTSAEQVQVADSPGADGRDATANLIWSAKESALKVLRTGLRADTRSVEVTLQGGDGEAPRSVTSEPGGWRRLSVASRAGELPGWWRRDGVFLLTVVAGSGLAEPPDVLPGSAALEHAEPIHSWLAHPLSD